MDSVFLCPGCGTVLQGETCPQCDDRLVYRFVQREVWLLLALTVLTVPLFFFTRALAQRVHRDQLRGGAVWYERGQQRLQSGDTRSALRFFRQAATADHENLTYSLALAQALARTERVDEAQRLLLQMREDQPEDAGINLQLGRLAARQGDIARAVLSYHHALYGRWPENEPTETRTAVRKELIHLLLLHRQFATASSELLLLIPELPHTPAELSQAGHMFLAAGDPRQALPLFQSSLKLDRSHAAALAGAGEASFQLGDYAAARRYWQRAPDLAPSLRNLQHVAELVLANDPQSARLTEAQRTQRLIADVEATLQHLNACSGSPETFVPLRGEGESLQGSLKPRGVLHDPAAIDSALDWVYRAQTAVTRACGSSPLQRALLLLSRRAGGQLNP